MHFALAGSLVGNRGQFDFFRTAAGWHGIRHAAPDHRPDTGNSAEL
jgi:hypothetical protein